MQDDLADQNRDSSAAWRASPAPASPSARCILPATAGVTDASLKVRLSHRFELTADLRGRFSAGQTDASASLGGLFRF